MLSLQYFPVRAFQRYPSLATISKFRVHTRFFATTSSESEKPIPVKEKVIAPKFNTTAEGFRPLGLCDDLINALSFQSMIKKFFFLSSFSNLSLF